METAELVRAPAGTGCALPGVGDELLGDELEPAHPKRQQPAASELKVASICRRESSLDMPDFFERRFRGSPIAVTILSVQVKIRINWLTYQTRQSESKAESYLHRTFYLQLEPYDVLKVLMLLARHPQGEIIEAVKDFCTHGV
jgi:hypothetical protein